MKEKNASIADKPAGLSAREKFGYAVRRARGLPIEYDLRCYYRLLGDIRAMDCSMSTEADLGSRAAALKSIQRSRGEDAVSEECVIEGFALLAELFRRRLDVNLYDVQLIAGLAMQEGRLAQLATGEGKTFAAALPAAIQALGGKGVHVLTANDYLARRDALWMRPVYEGMGLSVAFIGAETDEAQRRRAYAADICYLTAREAGFDYLRDQLRYHPADIAHRPFNSAIVDEADSILIDEARVPLVIAGFSDSDSIDLADTDRLARNLVQGLEFAVDMKKRCIVFPDPGRQSLEAKLGFMDLEEEAQAQRFARLHAALVARYVLVRDLDYVVRQDRVDLVDEFTGRIAQSRRWPYRVQAALEAKEGLPIRPEGRVYGFIAIQHLMSLYPRLSAMTATALPSAAELFNAYGLRSLIIPPHLPSQRIDHDDVLFGSLAEKNDALAAEIGSAHALGRPVLVGTASIAESEELGRRLRDRGIECAILNAKSDESEAAVISHAGRLGAVTISTNMAGRGTDIRLGGPDDGQGGTDDALAQERRCLIDLGGLYVIGTNRHESRRIDDQLRGRAGRQGEPGGSRFFLSLEDPLFVRYGFKEFLAPEFHAASPGRAGGRIEDPRVNAEIDRAQRIIESYNASLRRSLRKNALMLEYQRQYIRQMRDDALLDGILPARLAEAASANAISSNAAGSGPSLAVQLFLRVLDRFWSDHLAFAEELKEGVHLVRYGGRDPDIEFGKHLGEAFESGLEKAIEQAAQAVCNMALDFQQADLDAISPKRPSGTWTYQVDSEALPSPGLSLLSSANIGTAALAALPLLLVRHLAAAINKIAGIFKVRRGS